MKFIVEKTKPGFFEDEYDVRLKISDRTKKVLHASVLGLSVLGPVAYFALKDNEPSSETANDPETTQSP